MEKNKKLMLGNEAIARGLYEAGCRLVSSYPGTPSTEISECAAKYDEIYAEWAPNEKVALETALGAAIAGGRSFCAMKHVGLNVAADPLFITGYTGINAGMVITVADDPGMHSSQNEQDSRHYAMAAKLPMLEPCDSGEALAFTKLAYDLSEQYDTPFIIRMTTRVAHSQSLVPLSDRQEREIKPYEKNPQKYVMMPAYARPKHKVCEDRLDSLRVLAERTDAGINRIEYNSPKTGIIASGVNYDYAKEAFGLDASYLKLGMVFPLPEKLIFEFASKVDRLIIVEDLDPIIETHVKALGIKCDGKNLLPITGEFSHTMLLELLRGKKTEKLSMDEALPGRPPVMCPGCPHRGLFYTLKKMKLTVMGDIGCYTLGAAPPLSAMDTTLCMGASISSIHGFTKIRPDDAKKTVAVIGDSTFMHSGITGLVNITYNKGISTVLILDNSITGMTGHQQNPCTGFTLKNEPVRGILPEKIAEAAGVDPEHIKIADPGDPAALEKIIAAELSCDCPSVVIVRRPCALLKCVKKDSFCLIDTDKCKKCRACMNIGCPCISIGADGRPVIDNSLCTGCGLCEKMCRFGAIKTIKR
ncbi:MAG: indolepyruvate ferredoxin oxidoreductase subunit alpha [Oscillospiraceae bacterium]|nr:indolepyruvate ferredoxin oxidoreductase subunit alpha [Oscillospiraceae bacterium]